MQRLLAIEPVAPAATIVEFRHLVEVGHYVRLFAFGRRMVALPEALPCATDYLRSILSAQGMLTIDGNVSEPILSCHNLRDTAVEEKRALVVNDSTALQLAQLQDSAFACDVSAYHRAVVARHRERLRLDDRVQLPITPCPVRTLLNVFRSRRGQRGLIPLWQRLPYVAMYRAMLTGDQRFVVVGRMLMQPYADANCDGAIGFWGSRIFIPYGPTHQLRIDQEPNDVIAAIQRVIDPIIKIYDVYRLMGPGLGEPESAYVHLPNRAGRRKRKALAAKAEAEAREEAGMSRDRKLPRIAAAAMPAAAEPAVARQELEVNMAVAPHEPAPQPIDKLQLQARSLASARPEFDGARAADISDRERKRQEGIACGIDVDGDDDDNEEMNGPPEPHGYPTCTYDFASPPDEAELQDLLLTGKGTKDTLPSRYGPCNWSHRARACSDDHCIQACGDAGARLSLRRCSLRTARACPALVGRAMGDAVPGQAREERSRTTRPTGEPPGAYACGRCARVRPRVAHASRCFDTGAAAFCSRTLGGDSQRHCATW